MVHELVSDHFPVAAEPIAAKSIGPWFEAKKKRVMLGTDSEKLYAKAAAFFLNLPTLTSDNFNGNILTSSQKSYFS